MLLQILLKIYSYFQIKTNVTRKYTRYMSNIQKVLEKLQHKNKVKMPSQIWTKKGYNLSKCKMHMSRSDTKCNE